MYVGGDEDENIFDYVLLHKEDGEIQHSQHDDQWLGRIQKSTSGIGVDLGEGG